MQERLQVLARFTGSFLDAVFQHVVPFPDVDELLAMRRKQVAFLARYGRQSMLQWGDVETRTINECVEDIADLLREENALVNKHDDD